VGALNVGSIKFDFNSRIKTNTKNNYTQYINNEETMINKGKILGNFEMGSTIVVVSQEGFIAPLIHDNDNVKYSDTIATIL
jgi:phosphatidylserine decarboxylase